MFALYQEPAHRRMHVNVNMLENTETKASMTGYSLHPTASRLQPTAFSLHPPATKQTSARLNLPGAASSMEKADESHHVLVFTNIHVGYV